VACGRSKREVEELVARHFPQPDVPSSVRELAAAGAVAAPALPLAPDSAQPTIEAGGATAPSPACAPTVPAVASIAPTASAHPASAHAVPAGRPPLVAPLAPDRYQIRFTANAQTCQKLRLAQDLLRHAVPNGDVAEIVDRALTLLLEDLKRKKFAETRRPRASRQTSQPSRHIPAEVKRAVRLRDGDRCAFAGTNGRRCSARTLLEFHHVKPYGMGGEATVDNIHLRCGPHNRYEAELYYGAGRSPGGESLFRERVAPYLAVVGNLPRNELKLGRQPRE
jgi:5-methylcytosine-specific restriction endonuclease McrA